DIAYGGAGNDSISGDGGIDVLFGDGGDDTLDGGTWDDDLIGGDGADVLNGGAGNDALSGVNLTRDLTPEEIASLRDQDEGATLEGVGFSNAADGADTLDGGAGNDFLLMGAGDTGTGGEGQDDFSLYMSQDATGVITITDYTAGEDVVQLVFDNGSETVNADDYSVENDAETGDALILQQGEVVARLQGAGDTFTADDLVLIDAA
uniref:calcium-binding protein n=1 Tax=Leisingera sp. F5 TaxID=1813816 RepID=UPI000AED86BF